MLNRNTWNHLCAKYSLTIYIYIYIYIYKHDLALNNSQELTCHKTQPNQPFFFFFFFFFFLFLLLLLLLFVKVVVIFLKSLDCLVQVSILE